MMADTDQDEAAIWIDGQPYTINDLTFREQRKLREFVRELAPGNDPDEAAEADIVPSLIAVIKQRDDEAFTLDQALDFKPGDLERPPTKARAAKKS